MTIAQLATASDFDFAKLFAQLRTRRGLSARALSAAAGVSPSYVSKLERGEFVPTLDTFARLVAELECSDAEILFLVKMMA